MTKELELPPAKRKMPVRKKSSLYDRIGGDAALAAAIDIFYGRVLRDRVLKPFFAAADINRLKAERHALLRRALDSPKRRETTGTSDPSGALGVEVKHVERAAKHFKAALQAIGLSEPLTGQIVQQVASLGPMIVGKAKQKEWGGSLKQLACGLEGEQEKAMANTDRVSRFAERKMGDAAEYRQQLAALGKSQAVIEFELDGTIITANENFLKTMGYLLDELRGKHHRIFVGASYAGSADYRAFWDALGRGEYQAGEFKRLAKGGKEIWLQASYNPIIGVDGKPFKVVKFATDISAQKDLLRQFSHSAQQLASSSEELTTVSQQMASNAEETATQAGVVSAASEQVTENVQTVAASSEEMTSSITEIARSSSEAAKIAKQAVDVAGSANSKIKELGDSSVEIGKVIKVITSIAQQTNLLALNATIEAARAGEAGKGFAVVANEVKELAKQTAQATEDISQKIEAIQTGSQGAVAAIGEVGTIINQINDISNTIASSVEEQTATTNEISRNVSQAARGSAEIGENICGVAQAAADTTQGANDTLEASKNLAEMAAQLQRLVEQFEM